MAIPKAMRGRPLDVKCLAHNSATIREIYDLWFNEGEVTWEQALCMMVSHLHFENEALKAELLRCDLARTVPCDPIEARPLSEIERWEQNARAATWDEAASAVAQATAFEIGRSHDAILAAEFIRQFGQRLRQGWRMYEFVQSPPLPDCPEGASMSIELRRGRRPVNIAHVDFSKIAHFEAASAMEAKCEREALNALVGTGTIEPENGVQIEPHSDGDGCADPSAAGECHEFVAGLNLLQCVTCGRLATDHQAECSPEPEEIEQALE